MVNDWSVSNNFKSHYNSEQNFIELIVLRKLLCDQIDNDQIIVACYQLSH